MDDILVTVQHLHTVPGFSSKAGYCNTQTRIFFARHGLSWNDFITNGGITASKLVATNDALALRLVEWAREQTGELNG